MLQHSDIKKTTTYKYISCIYIYTYIYIYISLPFSRLNQGFPSSSAHREKQAMTLWPQQNTSIHLLSKKSLLNLNFASKSYFRVGGLWAPKILQPVVFIYCVRDNRPSLPFSRLNQGFPSSSAHREKQAMTLWPQQNTSIHLLSKKSLLNLNFASKSYFHFFGTAPQDKREQRTA